MSSDPKAPGEPPAAPETVPKKPDQRQKPKSPYGGVWAGGGPRDDTSGQGSAPRAPGVRPGAPEGPHAPHQPSACPVRPCTPDQPHEKGNVYGGVWSSEGPRVDTSGRGSAPRPPGAPGPSERRSFSGEGSPDEDEAPDIAADDAGASARTETPQRKPE